jgi:hypothetical protein
MDWRNPSARETARLGDAQTGTSELVGGTASLDRIFEPNFTLAICGSIVEACGGRLQAEKHDPQAATFVSSCPGEVKVP